MEGCIPTDRGGNKADRQVLPGTLHRTGAQPQFLRAF